MTKRQKLAVYRHQRSVILARIGTLRDQLVGQTSASAFATIDADLRFERDSLAWQRKWLARA